MVDTVGETTRKCPKHLVLPIIFIPGIMGTRLERSEDGQPVEVWEASTSQAVSWYTGVEEDPDWRRENFVGAPTQNFSPNYLDIALNSAQMQDTDNLPNFAFQRNWGGLAWRSYEGIMMWLHRMLKGQLVVQEAAFANTEIQVWAHPYNWTDDNKNSGKKLKKTVADAIKEADEFVAENEEYTAVKPILLTHSMGGLVARAYAKTLGCEGDVQAIIHGAMPTHGSPAAYKRMRAGNEGGGFEGNVGREYLGWSATQVTAVLGNIPGGLELLPNQYHTSISGASRWLYLTHTNKGDIFSFPTSDPYSEIYSNTSSWWRLIDPALLNPDLTGARQVASAVINYKTLLLGTVKKFHSDLNASGDFHSTTYMFYANSSANRCWDQVEWKLEDLGDEDAEFRNRMKSLMLSGSLPEEDDREGELEFVAGTNYGGFNNVEAYVRIQAASANGDGTVHAGSGMGLPASVISEATPNASFSHETAYNSNAARVQVRDWIIEIMADELACP